MVKKNCFVICPIGNDESEERKHSNKLLKHVINPVAEKCGYSLPQRSDLFKEPGLITNQIIQHLHKDELVIADLSTLNPNVFYELAFRHTIKKPVIHMQKKNDTLPFDVKDSRTIIFDLQDLDNVEMVKKELEDQILSIEKTKTSFFNPISISFDFEKLTTSSNPYEKTIVELFEEIKNIRKLIQEDKDSKNKVSLGQFPYSFLPLQSVLNLQPGLELNPIPPQHSIEKSIQGVKSTKSKNLSNNKKKK